MIDSPASPTDTEVAAAAALAGAEIVRARYGRLHSRIDKGAGDFATDVDVAAEEAILDVIRAARPGDAVHGEEGGRRGAVDAVREWLVDPLCGTLNYATGSHLVAVNVALRNGPAAVADPFSGEVFLTDGETGWVQYDADADGYGKGKGRTGVRGRAVGDGHASGPVARRRPVDEEQLAPTADTRLVDVNLDPPFPGAPAFRAVDLLAHPGFVEHFRPRVVSTTLALAWVAAGRRAAYVTDGGDLSGSVHFAAGIALCRAAGCVVTGVDGGPVGPEGRGLVVAADAATHGLLMSLIRGRGRGRSA
ncbi:MULTISPECIES: inositol monophosphatase family protein [Streptomyces]|uniref:inositol monophosphatase family protein n=1 Tax=Streptomyces TaxID=1883 RepID=UPI00093AA5CA|nr:MULTISPECIES: inositol monophosphatase family protein [unclassified Streptomyces]OKJ12789.1 phosphatase [Streptomyces sp. TSRI0261]QNQ36800.1 inositol monophosphatase family protein [Streptomyces sp. CB00271]